MPNRVSCNGSNEITLQELVTAINLIDYERGGIAWKTALPYQPGDLVSLDLAGPGMYELYRCTSPHTSVDITVPAEFNNWELVTSAELGGVHYKGASGYSAGDIVTADVDNGVDPITTSVYRCTSTYTSGAGTPVSFNAEIANWTEIVGAPERGGVAYNASTAYEKGDIVVDLTNFSTYKCTFSGTTNQPSAQIGGWDPVTDPEIGGVAWRNDYLYDIGDVISYNNMLYISLTDTGNLGVLPDTAPLKWKVVEGSERGGVAYNASTVYEKGDIVVDLANFSTYKCTFSGTTNQPSAQIGGWDPVTDPEIGGVAWSNTYLYDIGDVISYDEVLYISLTDTGNLGVLPDTAPLKWKVVEGSERGGIFYQPLTTYQIGDIITADDGSDTQVYRCTTSYTSSIGGLPADFDSEKTNWEITGQEVAGRLWTTDTDYLTGDLITFDDITDVVYICQRDHTSNSGDNIDGDPTKPLQTSWDPLAIPEVGGRVWIMGNDYIIGDIVTDPFNEYIYKALADNTGLQPHLNATEWELIATGPEKGGVFYQANTNYVRGDIITANDNVEDELYRCSLSYTSASGGNPADFMNEQSNWVKATNPHGYQSSFGFAEYTPDEGNHDFFDYSLNQNADIKVPINHVSGNRGQIVLRQGNIGNHVVNWDPEYLFPSGIPVLGTNPHDTDLFNYYVLSPIHIIIEFVSSLNIVINPPVVITDFNATDIQIAQITMTWTEQPGEVYDLYNSIGLVQRNINTGFILPIVGTDVYYIRASNTYGYADSNTDSGTGVATNAVVITDFNATDSQINQITFSWTEQAGETYALYNPSGLVTANVNTGYILSIAGTDDYYVIASTVLDTATSNTDSGTGVVLLPMVITDFNATDIQYSQITMTWTPTLGETYDLYNSLGLVQAGITSGYVYLWTGTEDFYIQAKTIAGTEDSNIDSGTGVIVVIAIADFAASDGLPSVVESTFTP